MKHITKYSKILICHWPWLYHPKRIKEFQTYRLGSANELIREHGEGKEIGKIYEPFLRSEQYREHGS